MYKVLLFLLNISYGVSGFSQYSPGFYALKDVSVIDMVSGKVANHYTIIIRHNIIETVGPVMEVVIPDSAVLFNYPGRYVIPGLIDSHVHLATDPSGDDTRAHAEKELKDMLLSGITTVRDMAGDARSLAGLSRDAELDEITSPDIYYAALMAGPAFFKDPRTHMSTQGGITGNMPFMKAVTDSTDLSLAVAEARGSGATGIKLYAELDGKLAKRITTEAHRQHMLVWSHANLDKASALEVVNAGVDAISHAAMISGWYSRNIMVSGWYSKKIPESYFQPGLKEIFWDSIFNLMPAMDLIKAMQANHTLLDATVLVYKESGSDTTLPIDRRLAWYAMFEIGKRFTALAIQKGIPVSTGTDLDDKHFVQKEIKLLVSDCGFTPMQVLISATRNGALAVGKEDKIGTVEKGKLADLVILSANPLENIDNIDKVEIVVKNGKLYQP